MHLHLFRRKRLATGIFLSALAFSLAAVASEPASGSAGQASRLVGASLYQRFGCYQCHGFAGQGSILTGPALAGRNLSVDHIVRYSRKPLGVMPPYRSTVISDADLRQIAVFVSSLPMGRRSEQIPLLARFASKAEPTALAGRGAAVQSNVAKGAALYAQNCAACHGPSLEGGVGPALRNWGARKSTRQTVELIQSPPPRMPKLYPKPLSSKDVEDIAVYLIR